MLMPLGALRPLWCHTCEEYVRPGSHGIYPGRPREPAIEAAPDAHLGDGYAILFVVGALAGAGIVVVAVVALFASA